MTQKLSSNGGGLKTAPEGLPKVPSEKSAFRQFAAKLIGLQPDCSILDLDNHSNWYVCPPDSDLGIWVDSWHTLVDILGTSEDAEAGIKTARNILYDLSCRFSHMLFSADCSRPPLDQFGSPSKSLEMLFRESTCYTDIRPVATYRGRKVLLGCMPTPSQWPSKLRKSL